MSASRLALGAAVCAVVAWAAKATAIGLAGGLDRSSAESPLFVVGLVAALVGAGAFGATLTMGRPVAIRVLGAVAVVAALLLVVAVVSAVVSLAQPEDPSWVWAEVNLWVSALLLLGAVLLWRSRGAAGAGRRTGAPGLR